MNFALDSGDILGVLSSYVHVVWALATGGRLGVGNDPIYNKTRCFEAFPFPEPTDSQRAHIRQLGESLDAHRKRQQAEHPTLTLTDMYNVLEKLRSGEPLTAKDKLTHEQGLVSVLKQIHDDLDRAVLDAYGWSDLIPLLDNRTRREELEETILERLVALNAERAEEERRGIIRWLRPEYQNPQGGATQELELEETETPTPAPAPKAAAKQPWPKSMKDQLLAVRSTLAAQSTAIAVAELARTFTGARADRVTEILESLESLGQAREVEEGRWL